MKASLKLPAAELELFFDIEVDPMRDLCYLHGFVERRGGDSGTETYVSFFIGQPDQDGERRAFSDAWDYLRRKEGAAVYYYSKYERTHLRLLWLRVDTGPMAAREQCSLGSVQDLVLGPLFAAEQSQPRRGDVAEHWASFAYR